MENMDSSTVESTVPRAVVGFYDEAPQVLYDADAQQRIPILVSRKIGEVLKSYEVFHTINACQDEEYVVFDKRCNVRVHTHPDKSIETLDEADAAAVMLYNSLKVKVQGWGADDGSNVDDDQKREIIFKNLLVSAIVPSEPQATVAGNADEDKPWEVGQNTGGISIGLRCLFNGQEIVTRHFLRPSSADQKNRFDSLTNRRKYQAGARLRRNDVIVPSIAKALGKLYDERQERAEGYSGRIPLWHKIALIYSDYNREDDPEAGEA